MPIVNIKDERDIVKRGLAEGKDPEFIKSAVMRYRERISPPSVNGTQAPADVSLPKENAQPTSSLNGYQAFAQKAGEVATGFAKGVGESAVGLPQLAFEIGARVGSLAPGVKYDDIINSAKEWAPLLTSKSKESEQLRGALEGKTGYEKLGKALEFAGELALGGVSKLSTKTATGAAGALEKGTLRLTGAQKRELGARTIKDVQDTLVKYAKPGSTESRYDKMGDVYEAFEDNLQNFLKTQARDRSVSKKEILNGLETLKKTYKGTSRDLIAIRGQIDDAIKNINANYFRDKIQLFKLNEFKRDTYRTAYNKVGSKVIDDVEFKIGDLLRNSIETATKGLKIQDQPLSVFNQEYGKIITTRKLLKAAIGRPEVGIPMRIAGTILGGGLGAQAGGPIGSAAGVVAVQPVTNILGGTAAKSSLAFLLKKFGQGGEKARSLLSSLVPKAGTALPAFGAASAAEKARQAGSSVLSPKKK